MVPQKPVTANSPPFQFSLRALVYFVCIAAVVCLCLRVSAEATLAVLGFLSVAVLFEVVLFSLMLRLTSSPANSGGETAAAMTALVTILVPAFLCLAGAVLSLFAP